MKGSFDRTKVVVRNLPPALTQSAFTEQIDGAFGGRYNWVSFRQGKTGQKHQSCARAYIDFKKPEGVLEFAEFFNGHIFVNEKGAQFKTIVEYAPSQRVPKQWSKSDSREGTLLKDPEYLEFLEFVAKPVENLPSAEIQLDRREAERAGAAIETLVVTPLMDFVRQKRAAKAGPRRLMSNGKLSRRASGSSTKVPASGSSKRGSEKKKASSTMYVLRDSAKKSSDKDKSTYILVPKHDDQGFDKPVSSSSATASEVVEKESGVSANIDAGKNKVLLLKGKERENFHVSSSVSERQSASVKNILGSPSLKQNQRRESRGRIIRGILLNKDARQSQAEQQMQNSNLEKDKRPPRPPHVQLIVKDTNGVPDDKLIFVNDLQSVKQERRTRNKDRPDRGVWTLRRSDGSCASDESFSSSASQLSLPAVDSSEGMWTPTGRRLITGSQSGEFTLWNGQSFNFEMILQAHDHAIRSMVWSHNDNWMVSGDDGGAIKYWQNNMNNVKANKSAHKESVRDLSFCRTDLKFCSCSDDTTVKVWDFARCQEERSLTGHGWDVKSVDWHPTKSLLVSGGKDSLVKLWDAKSGRELCSFHGHKNMVLCVKWNQNGNWLLTASKDQIIKLYDIRAMKELESFRGHRKDVTALAWHPFHEEYFVSGSFDGSIFHWLVGHETPQIEIPNAHDNSVWDLAWHPIGYLLCSGSNDHTTKFWCRNRPADTARDKFNVGQNQGYGEQNAALAGRMPGNFPLPEGPTTPGPFAPGLTRNEGTIPGVGVAMPLNIPSFDPSVQGEQNQPPSMPLGAPPLPPGPHPSLLTANQPQGYQQNPPQMPPQRHQGLPQQMHPLPMPPQNMPQLQPPSHLPLLPHPHMSRPPPHMPQHGMPSPSSHPMSMPGQMGMQGSMNQMVPPMQQGHYMGMNPMHSTGGAPPVGGFPNGMPNLQGPPNASGAQMYPQGGAFNRPQGQMPMMPGYNPYQSGNQSGMPPPPPAHGQNQQ